MRLLLIAMVLAIFACKEQHPQIVISGHTEALIGDTIYLKKLDHFDYLNQEYIIDSSIVDEHGDFQFQIDDRKDKLITLSRYKSAPNTNQIFKDEPEHYYYSFCANFFAMNPTLYVEGNKNYEISHWDTSNSDTSISYVSDKQNKMRTHYRNIDFRGKLSDVNRDFIQLTKENAWAIIEQYRGEKLKLMELTDSFPINSFEHHLKTELYLGAINAYLIWYSYETDGAIDGSFYKSLMDQYHSEQWNPNSVEYFKLTERYVTYQLNLKHGATEDYYKPSIEKIEFAKRFASKNVKEQYVANISKLVRGK